MALNLRSRQLNYHTTLNGLLLWANQVPKRLVQMFNQFGICPSYSFQARSVAALSKSALSLARGVANDPKKIIMLPYDNFNWTAHAWETTALHGSVTHDEVSALLVVLPIPNGCHAEPENITAVDSFKQTYDMRHKVPPRQSLTDILPSHEDQAAFRWNAILHVQQILVEEVKHLSDLKPEIPSFADLHALAPKKTEEYYLPTFDQEQGSTRGNMVVLEHYFGKVLDIPKRRFECTMFTVLGDRLTTARDRAAQDQRAVDRSAHRFDHLSSFSMASGLMHFCLNFIKAMGGNAWGGESGTDPVSLSVLCNLLPNRTDSINLRKVDYYAWLRFLDVILRSLVIKATMAAMDILSMEHFDEKMAGITTHTELEKISTHVVDSFIIPSPTSLEENGQKPLKGSTQSGHAILLIHDLMTLREMRHAIKHGHPTRIHRMIKYWLPMFYTAGSYNYANECMELLHNVCHDWPKDYAQVAFNGMLVNPSGRADGWNETDLRVEHLNDDIKERAHGSNATPNLLEKITPAMGHVQNLTDQLFEDLGVEQQNQRHADVLQHRDVQIVTAHLLKTKIFDFHHDKPSTHTVVDLYRWGISRLAGKNGGHAKHLARHILRLRARHSDTQLPGHIDSVDLAERADRELAMANDSERMIFTTNSKSHELDDFILQGEGEGDDENEWD